MPDTHVDNLKVGVSGTPGTGTATVGAAASGCRGFVAGDDGKTFSGRWTDGTAWETASGCLYTHSGTTLARGTLLASSTGSRLSLTSAAVFECSPVADLGNRLEKQLDRGIVIVRNDGSTTTSLSASTFTKLACINSEEFDPNGWWDNSNQKFQPTRAGRYLIVAGSQLTMAGGPGVVTSYLLVAYKNGTSFAHLARGWISGSGNVGVSGACIMDLNGSSDYVEPYGWQNDSASRSTVAGADRQFFTASYLSDT